MILFLKRAVKLKPKFVKRYAELDAAGREAVAAYAADVRARRFPGPEHLFGLTAPAPEPAPEQP